MLSLARSVPGFLPEAEGVALHEAALRAAGRGPLLEIGGYCGRSAIYLGTAARARGTVLFSVDHHRGSEEHQPGGSYHDPSLIDGGGRVDTLPHFRRTIARAGLEDTVIAIVGRSETVAEWWRTALGLVFIDGGHGEEAARGDYQGWTPHLAAGAVLAIHDVFSDPADGGQAPFRIYRRALGDGFQEMSATGSLRVLWRG
ncbi:MAG: class I SAM-dependent methyltransferase [Candidatus Dormibacteraceae bacterium]